MATGKRIYLVTQLVKDSDALGTKPIYRLINAASAPAARSHVAREHFQVEVATVAQAAQVAATGVKVEEAGE